MSVDELEVREMLGVGSRSGSSPSGYVLATEHEQSVQVAVRGVELYLTPSQARRFAAMLRRCAKRIEDRK